MKFTELDLKPELDKALKKIGYTDLTPIQEATFESIMNGEDLVGVAETGSGKTSACGIPIVQNVDVENKALQALVLVPTRELALQYVDEISKLSSGSKVQTFAIFGGFPMPIQEEKLKQGVHVLVATPGRLIDCIYKSKHLSLKGIKTLVLDEADEMLNMGFWDDVQFILSCIMSEHQTLLFSATMPKEIEKLIEGFLDSPKKIVLTGTRKAPQSLDHCFQSIKHHDRNKHLLDYLNNTKTEQVIIFCNSRHATADLYKEFKSKFKSMDFIHGGLDQNVRTSIFNRFKQGKVKYMIATDVAGRGLDFSKVTHVVNYDTPRELENYTHRSGRAGRMGRKGTAFSFITPRDRDLLKRVIAHHEITPVWIGEEPKDNPSDSSSGSKDSSPRRNQKRNSR